jgi:hypothetical protein
MQAEDYFNKIVSETKDATPGKMFGALAMKMPNGKAAAMFWNECLIVKLPEVKRDEALKLKGSQLFDPAGGRPMKEWVQIPFIHKNKWKGFVEASVRKVMQGENIKPKVAVKKGKK